MIVNNVAATSVSFGARRMLGGPKVSSDYNPNEIKQLLQGYATKDRVKLANEILTDRIGEVARRVDDLEAGQTGNLAEQVRGLTDRLEDLERSAVQNVQQNGSVMRFISDHKVALGVSAAALLAVGTAALAYSKHNKKLQAEKDATDPALYAPPPVNQTPQPAVVEAPAPSAPVSPSVNDYFVKTA